MNSCLIKNCAEESFEEGYCAKHYNEIVKKIFPEMKKEMPPQSKDRTKRLGTDEFVSNSQFFILSLLAYVDKFANRSIDAFSSLFTLTKRETSEIYRQMGDRLIVKKKNEKAIHVLKKIAELNPDDADSRYELGAAYLAESKADEAIKYLDQAIKLNPDNHKYHHKLGAAYEDKELWEKAVLSYNRAVQLNSGEAKLHFRLGVCFDNTEKFNDAVEAFKKAAELSPKKSSYHQSLGYAYESVDQHKDAVKCFKKAISLQREY